MLQRTEILSNNSSARRVRLPLGSPPQRDLAYRRLRRINLSIVLIGGPLFTHYHSNYNVLL